MFCLLPDTITFRVLSISSMVVPSVIIAHKKGGYLGSRAKILCYVDKNRYFFWLYPLIRTPVVLLVILGRAGWNGYQALLGTTGVPLVTREPDGSSTVGLLTT